VPVDIQNPLILPTRMMMMMMTMMIVMMMMMRVRCRPQTSRTTSRTTAGTSRSLARSRASRSWPPRPTSSPCGSHRYSLRQSLYAAPSHTILAQKASRSHIKPSRRLRRTFQKFGSQPGVKVMAAEANPHLHLDRTGTVYGNLCMPHPVVSAGEKASCRVATLRVCLSITLTLVLSPHSVPPPPPNPPCLSVNPLCRTFRSW
jgi:hypothetical protein